MRNVPDMLAYYIDTLKFGAYPFERVGYVITTPFVWGGMENQTMIMVWRSQVQDPTVSHELSHMWWGDMVTLIDFRNVWLNEGFATYIQDLYYGHENGYAQFLSYMAGEAATYFSEDAGHRFATYDPDIADVYAEGTIYDKGAWIQHMLRYVENDTVAGHPGIFFQALHDYGDSFKYGGVSSQDYQRVQEHVSGLDLSWFFNEWLYQAGYPQYRLVWTVESVGPGWRVVTSLTQNNGANAPAVFHMPIQIKLRKAGFDSLRVIAVGESAQIDTFMLPYRPDSLSFDPGKWILKKVKVTGLGIDGAPIQGGSDLQISGPTVVRGTVRLLCYVPEGHDPNRFDSGSCPWTARLVLYDALGRPVRSATLTSGMNHVQLDCSSLAVGVYIAQLHSGASSEPAACRKFIVTR
jgi:hypothetical protein